MKKLQEVKTGYFALRTAVDNLPLDARTEVDKRWIEGAFAALDWVLNNDRRALEDLLPTLNLKGDQPK